MSLLELYIIAALSTAILAFLTLYLPVLAIVKEKDPTASVVLQPKRAALAFILVCFLLAPIVLPSCFFYASGEHFKRGLFTSFSKRD